MKTRLWLPLIFLPTLLVPQDLARVEGVLKRLDTGEPIQEYSVTIGRATSLTDGRGRFAIDVAPGRYDLRVGQVPDRGLVRPSQGGGPRRLVVAAGDRVTDLEFALVPVGSLSGRVLDSKGQTLAGASVTAQTIRYASGVPILGGGWSRRTDDRGEFRLFNLPPGDYYIWCNSLQGDYRMTTFYPGVSDLDRATAVTVKSGVDTSRVDFSVGVVPTTKVSGRVISPIRAENDPRWVYSVNVVRHGMRFANIEGGNGAIVDRATGAFSVDLNLVGTYDFFATVQGYDVSPIEQRSGLPARLFAGKTSIQLRSDQSVTGLDAVVEPALALSGRIEAARPGSLDVSSLSLYPQLLVSEQNPGFPTGLELILQNPPQIRANGSFDFPPLPKGRYAVKVDGLPEGAFVSDLLQDGTSVLAEGFTSANEEAKTIRIVVDLNGATISGTVSDSSSVSARYRDVFLIPDPSRRHNPMFYSMTTTDSRGNFTFSGVAPGRYKIFSWRDLPLGAHTSPKFVAAYENEGIPITVNGNEKAASNIVIDIIE